MDHETRGSSDASHGVTATAEHRRHVRKRVMWSAVLETTQGDFSCVVFDISLGGAKLRIEDRITLYRPVTLIIKRFGRFPCVAVWQRESALGLRFVDEPERISAAFGASLPLSE